jgi:hypothetical protein
MANNSFRSKKFEDHVIVNSDGKVVGHIRIKPSGVLWAPANSKTWYGIRLDKFAEYMLTNGKKQQM